MGFQSVRDLDVKGHRVFLRADLNVPLKDGKITDATRIRETLPTLKCLLDGGASVVLASHLGRPEGKGFEAAYSAAPVAAWLKEQGFDCRLASYVNGEAVEGEAAALKPGQVLLLENLRFEKGETKNKEDFAASLAKLADTYVDDAFGAAHRAHASVSGMVVHFPKDRIAAGFLMEKELKALGKVTDHPDKPLVVIFGGAKVSDKIELIQNFLGKADAILIGGAMSYTFLKAQGYEIGKSLFEADKLDMSLDLLKQAEAKGTRLMLPLDHVAASEFKEDADCAITVDQNVPADRLALDIGPETVAAYAAEIRAANTLLWNGPMGVFEKPPFDRGTMALAMLLAESDAVTVVGGGESVAAAHAAGVAEKFTHVSTGGGASLEFITSGTLPGIEALK